MNNGIWIGRVAAANHLFIQYEPMARLVQGTWEKLTLEEKLTRFPKKGIVRGKPNKTRHSKVGSVCVFECRHNVTELNQWSVEAPERPMPILDLSKSSMEEARLCLFKIGIQLSDLLGSQYAVLLADNTYTILRFEKKGNLSFARLPTEGVIELRRADPAWIASDDMSLRYLPSKGEPLGEIVGQINWSSHVEFLGRLLERYRAALKGYQSLMQGGDAPLKKLEKAIAESGFGQESAAELESIVDRMRDEWPAISRSLKAVEGMTQLLTQTDEAKEMLATAVNSQRLELIAELELQARHEVDEMFKVRREELASIDRQIKVQSDQLIQVEALMTDLGMNKDQVFFELQQVNTELSATKFELQVTQREATELEQRSDHERKELDKIVLQHEKKSQALEQLRITVTTFIHDIRREVETSWTHDGGEVGIFAGRIEKLLAINGNSIAPMTPPSVPPWWIPIRSDAGLISLSELQGRLGQEAGDHGVSTDDLTLIDGFARAGEIVLLLGVQAELSLKAYARALSGGEVRYHSLDPSAIGLDDLWRVPASARPTAFALAWHHARINPQEIVLVCLRDFDAAPFRMWLASFYAVLSSDERPRNLLVTAVSSVASSIHANANAETGTDALHHLLVPIHPRSLPNGVVGKVVLDKPIPVTTRLTHKAEELLNPSYAVYIQLVKRGVHTRTVRRALRLFGVLGEVAMHEGRDVVASWAGYLNDGIASSLPESLADGYEGLQALAIQR